MKRVSVISLLLTLLAAAPATAQTIAPPPYFQVLDSSGNPVSGCHVHTYQAGTTTAATTYSDAALTTPNANPVICDSAGRVVIYLASGQSYKFTFETSASVVLKTVDNVQAIPASTGNLDVQGTAGEALTAGQVVYLSDGSGSKTAGKWYKADADETYSSTLPTVGIVPAAIAQDATGTVRIAGAVTGLSGLVVGTTYYISATAGAMTSSAPGNNRLLGSADSTTSLVLQINTAAPTIPISALTGTWTTQAFNAGHYTAGGTQTWTVAEADVSVNKYQLLGKTLLWQFMIATSTVAGAANPALRITLPAGKTIQTTTVTPIRIIDNNNPAFGFALATAGQTYIALYTAAVDTGNWSASTDQTYVQGQIMIEIQ